MPAGPTALPTVIVLGPALHAVSGVSTHLNQMLSSRLAQQVRLVHFQVGSQGRDASLPQTCWRLLASPLQLLRCLRRHGPAIVHINTSMDWKGYWRDLAYVLVARLAGKKIIYQVHGGALPSDFFRRSRLLTAWLRWTLQAVDLVVVLSQESLRDYRQFAPAVPVVVIPNAIAAGPDPDWKQARPGAAVLCLAYVGRLVASKGIFDIIDALAILVRARLPVRLLLAGNGNDESRLRQRVDQLRLQPWVTFLGVVEGAAKDRLWQQADLFLCPSQHEGLPYALLESMAARTPPVISSVGAIPDVIVDGLHGLFIPRSDPAALAAAIARLERDRPLIRRMGALCRQRVLDAYTVERLADDLALAYWSVAPAALAAGPGPAPASDAAGSGQTARADNDAASPT